MFLNGAGSSRFVWLRRPVRIKQLGPAALDPMTRGSAQQGGAR